MNVLQMRNRDKVAQKTERFFDTAAGWQVFDPSQHSLPFGVERHGQRDLE